MKRKSIKYISAIVAMCMLISCFYVTCITSADSGSFKELTLADFGLEDMELNNSSKAGEYDSSLLDGTAVSVAITFPKAEKNYYYIGGSTSGIRFEPQSDGTIKVAFVKGAVVKNVVSLTAEQAGVAALTNEELILRVTVELENIASNKADVKLGIYINGKLYDDKIILIEGRNTGALQRKIGFVSKNGKIKIASVEKESDPGEVPEEFPTYLVKRTFNDYGIANGNVTWATSVKQGSVVGNAFSGYITFKGKNMWFQYGGDGTGKDDFWKGMRFACDGEKLTLSSSTGEFSGTYNFYSSLAKTKLIDNKFLLQITAEAVDHSNDGNQNDVKLGVWFDGVLYKNEYIYLTDAVGKLGNNFAVIQKDQRPADGSAVVESYVERSQETELFPANLIKRTFNDFGVGNGDVSWFTSINNDNTVVGTAFSGYVTFHGKNVWMQYGGAGAGKDDFWKGIRFAFDGTDLILSPSAGEFSGTYRFTPDIAKTQFSETKVLLQITAERVDSDNDGAVDDVKLGVWFNGILYDNVYIYLVDAADNLRHNFALVQRDQKPDEGYITVESYAERSAEIEKVPSDLPVVTFTDYDITDRTTTWQTKICRGNIVDTVFSGYFSIHGKMWFQYGGKGSGKDDFWKGIRIAFDGQNMYLGSSNGEFKGSYKFTSEKAGVRLYDNLFLLQLSFQRVDSDNDKIADDVKLGVFFNGVLYDNTYLYLVDAADKFGNNIAIIQPDQVSANGHAMIQSIKKPVDFTEFGFTEQWKKLLKLG